MDGPPRGRRKEGIGVGIGAGIRRPEVVDGIVFGVRVDFSD